MYNFLAQPNHDVLYNTIKRPKIYQSGQANFLIRIAGVYYVLTARFCTNVCLRAGECSLRGKVESYQAGEARAVRVTLAQAAPEGV